MGPEEESSWIDRFPRATTEQSLVLWKQAWLEQRNRASSNLLAWFTTLALLILSNIGWVWWTFWRK